MQPTFGIPSGTIPGDGPVSVMPDTQPLAVGAGLVASALASGGEVQTAWTARAVLQTPASAGSANQVAVWDGSGQLEARPVTIDSAGDLEAPSVGVKASSGAGVLRFHDGVSYKSTISHDGSQGLKLETPRVQLDTGYMVNSQNLTWSLGNRHVRFYAGGNSSVIVEGNAASTVPIYVRAGESQLANIQEWRDDDNSVLASVGRHGQVNCVSVQSTGDVQSAGEVHSNSLHVDGGVLLGATAFTDAAQKFYFKGTHSSGHAPEGVVVYDLDLGSGSYGGTREGLLIKALYDRGGSRGAALKVDATAGGTDSPHAFEALMHRTGDVGANSQTIVNIEGTGDWSSGSGASRRYVALRSAITPDASVSDSATKHYVAIHGKADTTNVTGGSARTIGGEFNSRGLYDVRGVEINADFQDNPSVARALQINTLSSSSSDYAIYQDDSNANNYFNGRMLIGVKSDSVPSGSASVSKAVIQVPQSESNTPVYLTMTDGQPGWAAFTFSDEGGTTNWIDPTITTNARGGKWGLQVRSNLAPQVDDQGNSAYRFLAFQSDGSTPLSDADLCVWSNAHSERMRLHNNGNLELTTGDLLVRSDTRWTRNAAGAFQLESYYDAGAAWQQGYRQEATAGGIAFALAGGAPEPLSTGWSGTNHTPTKTLDASTATASDLADVLCTLIEQLKLHNAIAA